MNHKPTVTIGIPAYNEEANIKNLLDSILAQRRNNFELEKIIVISDGGTDNTEKIVREFSKKNIIINLISDGRRVGKSERLNQIYLMNESDCLITIDADIEMEDEYVFEKLIESFGDSQVAVVAGNARPLPGRTLIEKLIVAKDAWWYEARKDFKGGNNIYNSAGCCFALSKDFARSFHFRDKTVNDQEVIYLEAKRQNKKFVFAEKARFFYREASTWNELISRMRRFERQDNLESYGFGINIKDEYSLPLGNKMRGIWKAVSQNTFYGIGSLFLTVSLKFIPREKSESGGNNPALWKITKSSKKLHDSKSSNTPDYMCEVVNELDEKHENEWMDLWRKSKGRHFFNSPNFFQSCRESFDITSYAIIFCYLNGVLRGVLPLSKNKVFGVTAFIAPGNSGNYIDKYPLLVDEYSENIISAIFSSALELGHLYIAESDESAKKIMSSQDFMFFACPSSESPRMSLSGDTDILKHMSPDQRRNLNRHLRQQKESISFRVEGAEALEKVIRIEQGSYRPHYNMAFFNNDKSKNFIETISRRIPNSLHIGVLYLDNQPIAAILGFINEKTFYWYHTAFLERYRRIGPGKMALYLTLEDLKKQGFTEIDLLRGNSEIKRQFSDETIIQYDVYLSKSRMVIIWWKFNLMAWKMLKQIKSRLRKILLDLKRHRHSPFIDRFKFAEAK